MGHTIASLRSLRTDSIGSETGSTIYADNADVLARAASRSLDSRGLRIVSRYINDFSLVIDEIARVVRPRGQMTLVVADATVRGIPVHVGEIVDGLATSRGMTCVERIERPIAVGSRYLPPPTDGANALDKRMRVEQCLTYSVSRRRAPTASRRASSASVRSRPLQ
jgi:hypothetical protein